MSKRKLEYDLAITTTNVDDGDLVLPIEMDDVFPFIWVQLDIHMLYSLVRSSKSAYLRIILFIEEIIKQTQTTMTTIFGDKLFATTDSLKFALVNLFALKLPKYIMAYCAFLVDNIQWEYMSFILPSRIKLMTTFNSLDYSAITKIFSIMVLQYDVYEYVLRIMPDGATANRLSQLIPTTTPIKNVYYHYGNTSNIAVTDHPIKNITTFSYTPESRKKFMVNTMKLDDDDIKRIFSGLHNLSYQSKAARYYENTKDHHILKDVDDNTLIRNTALMDETTQEYHHIYHHIKPTTFFVCELGKEKALYISGLSRCRHEYARDCINRLKTITINKLPEI